MKNITLIPIILAGILLLTVIYFVTPVSNIFQGDNSDTPSDTNSETNPNSDTSTGTSSSSSSGTSSDSSSSDSSDSSSGTTSDSSSGDSSSTSSSSDSGTSTDTSPSGPAIVNLRTSGNFAILSKTGISTTGTTSITGDIGVSPIDHTAITGFSLIGDETTSTFLTSSLVTGNIYAANLVSPTPTMLTTAIGDMETAYADAFGRTNPTATELGAGDISGMTLTPGLYKWGTGLMINSGVTLSCQNSEDTFIFQIAEDLTIGNGAIVTLSGGCQTKNIFWQVTGQATLGTTSQFKGNILSATLIEMNTGATLDGRALAQTAVTLDSNAITKSN